MHVLNVVVFKLWTTIPSSPSSCSLQAFLLSSTSINTITLTLKFLPTKYNRTITHHPSHSSHSTNTRNYSCSSGFSYLPSLSPVVTFPIVSSVSSSAFFTLQIRLIRVSRKYLSYHCTSIQHMILTGSYTFIHYAVLHAMYNNCHV